MKNEELIREKNRLERDVIETTTNELKQRVSSLNAVKCRLEREMLENRNHMQEAIDSLKLEKRGEASRFHDSGGAQGGGGASGDCLQRVGSAGG